MVKKIQYKYIVAIVYIFILFLDRMDLTITNVAMLSFAHDFQIKVTETDWISTAFLIAVTLSMPVSGYLSERFGSKRIFILSNIIFTFSSLFCAFSASLSMLIFFRILQGIGGGLLVPTGMGMVYRTFSVHEYPKLANYTLIPTLIAPSISPIVGGLILKYLSWHWIFILHLPIGLCSIVMSIFFLKEEDISSNLKFDWTGFSFLSICLFSLFYFLSELGKKQNSEQLLVLSAIIFVLFFISYIYYSFVAKNPVLQLRFFKKKLFSQAIILQITMQISYFGSMFLQALYFQHCVGMTPLQSGLSIAGQAMGTIMMLFFSAKLKLFNRYGPKYSIVVGLFLIAIITNFIVVVKAPEQVLLAFFILWLRGLSIGLVNGPLQACAMFDLAKNETAKGSAIFNVIRQVGISLGVAFSSMALELQFRSSSYAQHAESFANTYPAYKFTFYLISILAIIAGFFALTIDNRSILAKLNRV